jgi:hypothetical protein
MANVRAREARQATRREVRGRCALALSLAVVCLLQFGCASPGEPSTRRPPIPTAITDLTAKQQGNEVLLTFTLPTESIDRHPLKTTPTVEILRDVTPQGAAANAQTALAVRPNLTPVATLPPTTVDGLLQNRQVKFTEPLSAADFGTAPFNAVYVVRTFEREKKPSADSNAVAVMLRPMYPPIADAKAENAQDGVAVTWTAPAQTLTGTTPPITTYRIYRSVISTAAGASAAKPTGAGAAQKPALQRIGDAAASPFHDSQAELGATYEYSVRSVVAYDGQPPLESSDSNVTEVTAKDVFPPAAPQELIVTLIPAQAATGNFAASPVYLELSWAIAPERDVAGYNVYRSETAGERGQRQNPDLLPTPAFRDMNVAPGKTYYYTVSAVDRAGNESAPSAAVQGTASE